MVRKEFLKASLLGLIAFPIYSFMHKLNWVLEPASYYFKGDGIIPNSKFPLLVYKNAFNERGNAGAEWLEKKFKSNNWYNSWRWGVYPFHHYHSNSHEVLGIFKGNALLHMGGVNGKKMKVTAGDVLVIPAGVGHKCIEHSDDFMVVGAYPNGMSPDLVKEEKNKYANSLLNIAKVPFPETDPLHGKISGLEKIWKK